MGERSACNQKNGEEREPENAMTGRWSGKGLRIGESEVRQSRRREVRGQEKAGLERWNGECSRYEKRGSGGGGGGESGGGESGSGGV